MGTEKRQKIQKRLRTRKSRIVVLKLEAGVQEKIF